MTNVVKQIASCEKLGIVIPIEGVCFGHALFKACQYATSNDNIKNWPNDTRFARCEAFVRVHISS
jgi:hypothetical protein